MAILPVVALGSAFTAAAWATVPGGGNVAARQLFESQLAAPDKALNLGLSYWIELLRDGKFYRCNNKFPFRSGDSIRIHMMPNVDGYAYILLRSGSRGEKAVLFPNAQSGTDNKVVRGRDYGLPTAARLKFDNDPGKERLTLMLSRRPIDIAGYLYRLDNQVAFVSSTASGAKDLVPTRIQLCWDDPAPVILPQELLPPSSAQAPPAKGEVAVEEVAPAAGGGLVTVVHDNPDGVLAVDVELEHL